MSRPVPFRQSYAKTLLNECPALLRRQLIEESQQSNAMRKGSLLDALVFNQDDRIELVTACYRSGPRKGEPAIDWQGTEARAAKERVEAGGKIPALVTELDALEADVLAIKARILELAKQAAVGYDFDLKYQQRIEWTSDLGVECAGTPDVFVIIPMREMIKTASIDVKHTAAVQPDKFARQVYAMGWDVQFGAYHEGIPRWVSAQPEHAGSKFAIHQEHWILCTSSIHAGLPPCARELGPTYRSVGSARWAKAQRMWKECLDRDFWPSYDESPVEPSVYVQRVAERELFAQVDGAPIDIEEEP